MDQNKIDDFEIDFLDENDEEDTYNYGYYKVVIADDDEEVHHMTKIILKDFVFDGYKLTLIDTYSGAETIKVLEENPDTAILFLDVVMEKSQSGLEVVKALRDDLNNKLTRIILRTGQPGEAPEDEVIKNYDINDYRLKTELTIQRLNTTLYAALRNYRDLVHLDNHRMGLEKIIEASGKLFKNNSFNDFLTSILNEVSNFYRHNTELLYIRHDNNEIKESNSGFVSVSTSNRPMIVAATGKYLPFVNQEIESIPELNFINRWMHRPEKNDEKIEYIENGFIIKSEASAEFTNYIFIEGNKDLYDFSLINLFLTNYAYALDNYILRNIVSSTQEEMIFALGEVVESHFEETSGHVRRISNMMYKFCLLNNFSYAESEVMKIASTMHDVGKIGIPDSILKKPGALTDEEFEAIKKHTAIGYKIMSKSQLGTLQLASEIAVNHHEKFDGSGYPAGKKGLDIPLNARILAIIDVYDAMTHKRCYKDALPQEDALAYLAEQRGKHFDPNLIDIFLNNLDEIISIERN